MSEAMRRKIEAQKQRAEDADLAPQMSKQQTADHERIIASILRPRESVLQALKRLRGPAPAKTAARKQAKLTTDQVRHCSTVRRVSITEGPAKRVSMCNRVSLVQACSALVCSHMAGPAHLACSAQAVRPSPLAIKICLDCRAWHGLSMPGPAWACSVTV